VQLLKKICLSVLACLLVRAAGAAEQVYCDWQMQDYAIAQPLCGLRGDPGRGRALAADSHAGNCLACHRMPIPEEPFHGTVVLP
jgi:sulfur-oxidizing protein SoxX